MNGPQHYRTAETLLENLRREMSGTPGALLHTPEQQGRMIAEAQVHATLALAAASVHEAIRQTEPTVEADRQWIEAAS